PTSQRLQVTCSSKRIAGAERHINGIGGLDNGVVWGLSRSAAAELINKKEKSFFVKDLAGNGVEIVSIQGGFVNNQPWFFLQTVADGNKGNNLLKLPDCPFNAFLVEVWF